MAASGCTWYLIDMRKLTITDEQWERIRHHFPEESGPPGRRGGPPVPARDILDAVLWILHAGAPWHMLPQCYPNCKTVHRRYQNWVREKVLEGILEDLLSELREQGVVGGSEAYIDASFARAKGGGAGVGNTKSGKGVKIMAVVDRCGLPLSLCTHAANRHEVKLVQLTLDLVFSGEKPANLVGDKAYDSDPLDRELREQGVEMIAPHRKNRTGKKTQDGRRFRRYKRRWIVERFFAWMQWNRRVLTRWEYYPENFLGFVQLSALCMFLK